MKKQFLLTLALVAAAAAGAKDVKVVSPNGRLAVTVTDTGGTIGYTAALDSQPLFSQGPLTLKLSDKTLGRNAKIGSVSTSTHSGTIKPVVPMKQAEISDCYSSATIAVGGYKMEFRVMDNAVVYRYILSEKGEVLVENESFNLTPAEEMNVHYQGTAWFRTSSENPYRHGFLADWQPDADMSTLPVVLSAVDRDLHLLISESDLRDYPGMFLRGSGSRRTLTSTFPPVALKEESQGDRARRFIETADYVARTSGQRSLPWRYIVVADSRGIIEQTLTAQLAGKCEIDDTSWIHPGQVAWDWWNHKILYGPDVDFQTGCNTKTYKYYIDFAARYNIPYIIMDEGWAKTTYDPFTPNDNLDLHDVIRYGKEKGVRVILWLTWTSVDENLDRLFATYAEWGVAGAKIDFMDRQDQWMVNYYERVVREAAKHHMLVDFHGAFKPAGLEQRYPNLLAYEGIRGLEQMDGCQPDNTLYIPFMRNAVGPADFTPGAMGNTQPEHLRYDWPNSLVVGTRAYHMALMTILETGTQMLCDSPTQYYKNPDCTAFITQIPCRWDETRCLAAEFGQYIVVAKRSGERWFVAGITNGTPRDITVSLDFLGSADYDLQFIADGYHAAYQAMDHVHETMRCPRTLSIHMARNGGYTAIITPNPNASGGSAARR